METLRGVDFTRYVLSVIIKHNKELQRGITCNADPSAPIFLANVHRLMGKLWFNIEQNQTKAVKVIEQKPI